MPCVCRDIRGVPVAFLRISFAALLMLALGACANFGAVKEFSQETEKLTLATGTELAFVSQHCAKVADARRVVEGVAVQGANCDKLQGAVGEMTLNTNVVLVTYAKTLHALADGSNFDYSANLTKTKASLAGLKDKSGASLIDKNVIDAPTAVADLLLKIATESQRREAVRRLVEQRPSLRVVATSLRTFFVVPCPRTSSYGLQLNEDDQGLKDLQASLSSLGRMEPIRAREWQDDVQARRKSIEKRVNGDVASRLGAAIDAWLNALDVFSEKAFEPDFKEWRDQFNALKEKTTAAATAVGSL